MGTVQYWTNGYAVQCDYPFAERYYGSGSAIYQEPDTDNWFRFPFGNVGGGRYNLTKVFVLYKRLDYVALDKVYIYDGVHEVQLFDMEYAYSPPSDNSTVIDRANTWELDKPHKTYYGIGIGVHVMFGHKEPSSPMNYAGIQFGAVGAEFED